MMIQKVLPIFVVVGPRYEMEDFRLIGVDILGRTASGIQCKNSYYFKIHWKVIYTHMYMVCC